MGKKFRLCINSQTPLVRFKISYQELVEKYSIPNESFELSGLQEGVDYDFSPGGVTAMLYPVIERMINLQIVTKPAWVSLSPGAPERISCDVAQLYNVWLDRKQLSLYANFKEGIWNEVHGLGRLEFNPEEYEAYVEYNWLCAKLMLGMLKDVDIYWIHDFQQLHLGNLIGPSSPAILQWHIPFNLEQVSDRLRMLILKSIEGFDSIIVSTKRDLQGLIHAGYRGKAYAIYPYLDEKIWLRPSEKSKDEIRAKFHFNSDDRLLLVVARMDPIKAQDVAIRATSGLRTRFPKAKLVLAGNGSFTGSSTGGLGHPKSSSWRNHLEEIIHDLKLQEHVVFTGHVSHDELNTLYSLSEAVLVPSKIEGFNLTAIEGWLHKKPCIVSQGAGVSELVHNEVNGYSFRPSDDRDMSEKLRLLLSSEEASAKMGENGSMMAKQCYVENAIKSLQEVFEQTSAAYSGSNS